MRTGRIGDRLRRARGRRALIIAGISSVLFHVLLAILALIGPWSEGAPSMKKGEPLIVDITPEKPEEPAPRGNPNRAVTSAPREAPPPAPKAAPPAPKAPPAPVAAPPRPAPPAPAPPPTAPAPPPQQVAKAPEPPPAPKASEPAPAPTPAPAAPKEPAASEPARPAPRGPSEATPAPAQPPNQRMARSSGGIDLPAAMLRRQPSGGGLQGGRGGVEGEPIPLDTPDPKYQDYFRILRERIQAKWSYPREAGDRGIGGELIIEFHIGKDGRLAYLEVRHASGVEVLDEYAVNAVKLAQPFPPVPDNIVNIPANRGLAINGKFVYHITENSLVKQFTR